MQYSLIKEINAKTMQAYLNKRIYEQLYWPNFFPLKATPFLTYETLIGSKGNRVAADVVTFETSAPLKTRKTVSKLAGEIPPIRMKKVMREKDLNTYNYLKALASDANQKALLDLIFNDVDACVDGPNARLEWLTLQALSQGYIALTKSNNAGVITENNIDFGLPDANKEVCAAANRYWTADTYATSTPITDIETICIEAAGYGVKFQHILMNKTKWQHFRVSTEVQTCIPYALYNGTKVTRKPTLQMVNDFLEGEDLPTIIIVDTYVDIEVANHTITATNPWTTANVTFIPQLNVGNMLHAPSAEELNPPKQVTQAKKGPILISKYSEVDPVAEFTKGEINAFPSWPLIDHTWILNTESHTTF